LKEELDIEREKERDRVVFLATSKPRSREVESEEYIEEVWEV
jgi:hypothetical protein